VEVSVRQAESVRRAHFGECWWFWVWAVAGGWRGRPYTATAPLGALTGAGVPFLLVAYLQRQGPGTVCWHTATASGCDDYLDPRPWLAIGLVLVLGGIGAFVGARRVP
jgi:hypothetical protein